VEKLPAGALRVMSRPERTRRHSRTNRGRGQASRRPHIARGLCQEAAAQGSLLELEQWTSFLLGRIWAHRNLGPDNSDVDPMLAAGTTVLDSFVDVGGAAAKTALVAVGRLDRGGLGRLAIRLAATLDDPIPGWIGEVGSAPIVHALSEHSPGDGEAFLLQARPLQGAGHMLAVFVDARLDGIAKHLALTRVVDPTDLTLQPGSAEVGSPRFRPVDPTVACRRVRRAIEVTDATRDPKVGDGYARYRALAIARVDPADPSHCVHGGDGGAGRTRG
jgi:hypothetical protein